MRARTIGAGLAVAILALLIWAVIIVIDTPRSRLTTGDSQSITSRAEAEYVQRLADCVACHSTPGGAPFAGGLKMGTPIGAIYSTNITPDPETGIGRYSLADFDNAVRNGVAKDGHRLYPAMPFPSYVKLRDEDVRKLYDFFMRFVLPVQQPNRPNEIKSPLNQRWPLALWSAIFVRSGAYQDRADKDPSWNRGAYIVESLGHCGSCHTARGWMFNELALDDQSDVYLSGASLDGWRASSLRGDTPLGLQSWGEAEVVSLLKTGHNAHATVFGSMLDAFNNSTQYMTDTDVAAVAHYLKSLRPRSGAKSKRFVYDEHTLRAFDSGDLSAAGSLEYLNHCSSCHGRDGRGRGELLPPLAGNPSVLEPDPVSVVNILLNGAGRIVVHGVPDSYRMTPFRVLLSDEQIAAVASFIRSSWGNDGGPVRATQVRDLRAATDPTSDHVILLKIR